VTDLEQLFSLPPYSLAKREKQKMLVDHLTRLNSRHAGACEPFAKIQQAYGILGKTFEKIEDFPYLPIRLFKEFDLKSIDESAVIKTLTSSGTTSSKVARIFLDKETSRFQTKALGVIMQDFIGKKRLPMLIVDSKNVIKDRRLFSARGAGILGMANFGRDHMYVLDENMNLKLDELREFIDKHKNEMILLFGFTYIVWLHLYKELKKSSIKIDLHDGVLIHSGGWKRLSEEAVDSSAFKQGLYDITGLKRVHNFYGMIEQIGSVYMECEEGFFHTPLYSDVIVRNPDDWSVQSFGQDGVIELVSILPHSYPGHILLTEDMGVIVGEDDCSCGRKGKYFKVLGRVPKAELRGCSDTYEA
jgi:phenylacetate-coenzyme A ligase PaaK-like adenylate-forming protein